MHDEAAALKEKHATVLSGLETLTEADAEREQQLKELTEALAQHRERVQGLNKFLESKDAELALRKDETAGLKKNMQRPYLR